jgi:hypothetical protein
MMQIVEVKDESTTSNIVSKYIDAMQIEINSSQRYKELNTWVIKKNLARYQSCAVKNILTNYCVL